MSFLCTTYVVCSCVYFHRCFVDKKWHVLAYVCFFPGNIGKEKGMMCYLKEENIVIYYTERDCLLGSHGRHEMTKSGSAIKKCHNINSITRIKRRMLCLCFSTFDFASMDTILRSKQSLLTKKKLLLIMRLWCLFQNLTFP